MNKFIAAVMILVIAAMVLYASDFFVDETPLKTSDNELQIDVIKPLEMVVNNNRSISKNTRDLTVQESLKEHEMSKRSEKYEYPFTKEGQSYITLGELLLKNKKKVDVNKFTGGLFKQIKQAKYNLKLAKEIAHLSKSMFIDTENGKVIDQKVYDEINKLSRGLIVGMNQPTQ